MPFVERRKERRIGQKELLSKSDLIITIDGQTGSGKWALAEALSKEYGLTLLNTGTSIRALALLAIEKGIVGTDETNVVAIPPNFSEKVIQMYDSMPTKLTIAAPKKDERVAQVLVGNRDMLGALSDYNKQMAIENLSSIIAATPEMRMRLYKLWHEATDRFGGAVIVGRKTGIDLFPQANLKVFLYADPEASASYRSAQNIMATKQVTSESSYVAHRDGRDRANGLLDQPTDALVIDTTQYLEDKAGIESLANLVKFHLDAKYSLR